MRAQERLPGDVRRQLATTCDLRQEAIPSLRYLGLTPNQVWGLIKTDEQWSSRRQVNARTWPAQFDAVGPPSRSWPYAPGCVFFIVSTGRHWRGAATTRSRDLKPMV